jgi:hypothetical protein
LQYINYVKWLRVNKLNYNLLLKSCLNTNINIFNSHIQRKGILKI